MTDPSRPRRSVLLRLLLWLGGLWLVLVLFGVLAVAFENWRGHRAWAACQRELAALGEKLQLKDFVPPPVPQEQNFAATALFAGLNYRPGQGGPGHMDWPHDYSRAQGELYKARKRGRRQDGPSSPDFTDLAAWQRAFRMVRHGDPDQPIPVEAPAEASAERTAALEVLEALKVYEPALNELRQAARRPASRFPIPYEEGDPMQLLLPHLAHFKGIFTVLQLRVRAGLAAGQRDGALEDVLLMLRLCDSLKDEPLLISQLVRNACFQITTSTLQEGLAWRQWTEPQLKPLQARFQQQDLLAAAQQALRAERAFAVASMEYLLRRPAPQSRNATFDDSLGPARVFQRYLPRGWLRFEQANYCRALQALLLPDADIQQRRIDPQVVSHKQAQYERSLGPPWKDMLKHRIFTRLLLPALGRTYTRFALAQTKADQAALACALERYRLATGDFPETLPALVPAYIERVPADVIDGAPMRYRRTPDGQFTLWSVGWNAQDEGGVPGRSANDTERGDWVWEYPQK